MIVGAVGAAWTPKALGPRIQEKFKMDASCGSASIWAILHVLNRGDHVIRSSFKNTVSPWRTLVRKRLRGQNGTCPTPELAKIRKNGKNEIHSCKNSLRKAKWQNIRILPLDAHFPLWDKVLRFLALQRSWLANLLLIFFHHSPSNIPGDSVALLEQNGQSIWPPFWGIGRERRSTLEERARRALKRKTEYMKHISYNKNSLYLNHNRC